MREFSIAYLSYDSSDADSIEAYAKQLEGMTFREVLELASDADEPRNYNNKCYKGGMGTLIEECFFGYSANSDQNADFNEAGVELKVSCFDIKRDGTPSAGERLVLTMIPLDRPIEDDFFASHVWHKSEKILLIYYERNRLRDSYDQIINFVKIITPSLTDLKIIKEDYNKIASIVKAGRAEELSESLTSYLGACTKGATAEKSQVNQYYPPYTKAKKRAFCFKRSYMDYILHTQMLGESSAENTIIKNDNVLDHMTFEQYVVSLIAPHVGKTDKELCQLLGMDYTGNKAQWSKIVYALLGVRGERAEEFDKANISVRTVRIEKRGCIKESLSLDTFKFKDLLEQVWEESPLRQYFEEKRFLFVIFRDIDGKLLLDGVKFWSMPVSDLDGSLRDCWERTKRIVAEGVELTITINEKGDVRIENNLPKIVDEGSIAHVRPHAPKRGYRLEDGSEYGDPDKYGDELPDGRIMTQQSFWLNSQYVYEIVSLDDE